MIEVKLGLLRNPQFKESFQKLMQAEMMPKYARRIGMIGKELDAALTKANTDYNDLLGQYVEEKEIDGQKQSIIPEEKMSAWVTANEVFHSALAKVNYERLELDRLEAAKLNALDMIYLEPILEDEGQTAPTEGAPHGHEEKSSEESH